MKTMLFTIGLAAVFAGAASAALPSVNNLKWRVRWAAARIQTFEADIRTFAAPKTTTTGHFVFKNGAKVFSSQKMETDLGGGKKAETLTVNDGVYVWTESKKPTEAQTTVTRKKAGKDPRERDPLACMQDLWSMPDLKVTGEDMLDGQNMWVLEATLKAEGDAAGGKVSAFIGQSDNIPHRILTFDKDGKEVSDTRLSNIKINGPVKDALFKYTPPKGAKVVDLDKPA
jgi:outer membrane lipoprotein-sorting protein